jgi:hypothetical protein
LLSANEEDSDEDSDTRMQRLEYRRRRDRRIPRGSLLMPWNSPWEMVLRSGNVQALITLSGFDNRSFYLIHELFAPIFNSHTPYSHDGFVSELNPEQNLGGRPRLCTSENALGLSLVYYRTKGQTFTLCTIFGMTHTPLSLWLRFSRRILRYLLFEHGAARIIMPSIEKVQQYQMNIVAKYPALQDVYCFADGLKIDLQSTSNFVAQAIHYNGWTHGHYITNIFIFVPDGTLIGAAVNYPGSFHDSTVCTMGGLYDRLQEMYDLCGGKCVMDSAFTSRDKPYVIKSSRDPFDAPTAQEAAGYIQATQLRQSAEWGMRALKGSFPRLTVPIVYEELGERKIIIEVAVLLYNWRANTVGLNQIRTTFMPFLDQDYRTLHGFNGYNI